MAKGYWIAHVTVTDPERYKDYVAANAAAFKKYNAKFLVRGGAYEQRAGTDKKQRHVILEFDSYATAKACYDSPEYQAACKIRDQASIDGSTAVQIEVGTTLANWPDSYTVPDGAAANNPGVTVAKDSPSAGFDTVTLTLVRAPDETKFARLKVNVTLP